MSNDAQPFVAENATRPEGLGCAGLLAGINLVLMGLIASAFAAGPYSNAAQEAWYRGGSIAFLTLGAILPIVVLIFIARKHRGSATPITIWMFAALLAFIGYAFMSGGGV